MRLHFNFEVRKLRPNGCLISEPVLLEIDNAIGSHWISNSPYANAAVFLAMDLVANMSVGPVGDED